MALLTLVAITDKTFFAVYGFALIMIHELGHILASIILKMRIREINFGIANIDISKPQDYDTRKFSEKVILILGGPIFNFLVFMIFLVMYLRTKNLNYLYIALQSVGIAVLNMLPIESLDGGELLALFIEKHSRYFGSCEKIFNLVSWICLFLLAIFWFFIIIKFRYGFSVILLILYLIYQKYI